MSLVNVPGILTTYGSRAWDQNYGGPPQTLTYYPTVVTLGDGNLFVMGGYTTTQPYGSQIKSWIVSEDLSVWTETATPPFQSIHPGGYRGRLDLNGFCCAKLSNSKIAVWGGWWAQWDGLTTTYGGDPLQMAALYDPEHNEWSVCPFQIPFTIDFNGVNTECLAVRGSKVIVPEILDPNNFVPGTFPKTQYAVIDFNLNTYKIYDAPVAVSAPSWTILNDGRVFCAGGLAPGAKPGDPAVAYCWTIDYDGNTQRYPNVRSYQTGGNAGWGRNYWNAYVAALPGDWVVVAGGYATLYTIRQAVGAMMNLDDMNWLPIADYPLASGKAPGGYFNDPRVVVNAFGRLSMIGGYDPNGVPSWEYDRVTNTWSTTNIPDVSADPDLTASNFMFRSIDGRLQRPTMLYFGASRWTLREQSFTIPHYLVTPGSGPRIPSDAYASFTAATNIADARIWIGRRDLFCVGYVVDGIEQPGGGAWFRVPVELFIDTQHSMEPEAAPVSWSQTGGLPH